MGSSGWRIRGGGFIDKTLPDALRLTPVALKAIFDQGILSRYSLGFLKERNWLDPSILGEIIGIDVNGAWVWLAQDTTGRRAVVEQNSSGIYGQEIISAIANVIQLPSFSGYFNDSAKLTNSKRTLKILDATLVGGVLADQPIAPAVASYYGCAQLKGVISDTAGGYTLTHQDEDDTPCDGGIDGRVDVDIPWNYQPALGNELAGAIFKCASDNKALEVDIGGGGGGEVLALVYEYWYET